jgi:hypothetical protein
MASRRAPIRGQVARVLNSRELAINRGSNDGVQEGMKFAVLNPAGENIRDPETGELLGSVYRPKVGVQIVTLRDRVAIGRTYRSSRVNVGGSGGLGMAENLFRPPKYETRYETLKTEDAEWEEIDESESIVKTGDPVEEILEQEEAGEAETHVADVGDELGQ